MRKCNSTNLERVRKIKTQHQRLLGRCQVGACAGRLLHLVSQCLHTRESPEFASAAPAAAGQVPGRCIKKFKGFWVKGSAELLSRCMLT
jgi:hypothetical protein